MAATDAFGNPIPSLGATGSPVTPSSPFSWGNTLTNTVAPGISGIIGNLIAPGPAQLGAQTQQQQSAFGQQMGINQLQRQNLVRGQLLPGAAETLGYTPAQGDALAQQYQDIQQPTVQTSVPSTASTLGKTALGLGVSVAPSIIKGLLPGAAGAGTSALPAATGLGTSIPAGTSVGATLGGAIDPATGLVGDAGAAVGTDAAALGSDAAGAVVPPSAAGITSGGASTGILGLGSTIPIIGALAGAALGIDLIWKSTQVHPVANEWVQGNQNKFDQVMANTDQAVAKGAMTQQQANVMKQTNAQNYLNQMIQFAQEGSKNMTVAQQALATFEKWYGSPAQYGVQMPFAPKGGG